LTPRDEALNALKTIIENRLRDHHLEHTEVLATDA
jgi:hypothetical protein